MLGFTDTFQFTATVKFSTCSHTGSQTGVEFMVNLYQSSSQRAVQILGVEMIGLSKQCQTIFRATVTSI